MKPYRLPLCVASVLAVFGLVSTSSAATGRSSTAPTLATAPIQYMTDTVNGTPCGVPPTPVLHYRVFYPKVRPGVTYPIVFGANGAGFEGNSDCYKGVNRWSNYDPILQTWAKAGFVAVNMEYHGYNDGLFGDSTCPTGNCAPPWGTVADGIVERNLKVAVQFFFDHQPELYGADESKGVLVFGGSAGGHGIYQLGLTGPVGTHHFAAAIAWSGMPNVTVAGSRVTTPYDKYMEIAGPGGSRFDFGNAYLRLNSASPALYLANGNDEMVNAESVQTTFDQCGVVHVSLCYLRIVDGGKAHAAQYKDYAFRGPSDPIEVTDPPATVGMTVFQDTICFAKRVLAIPDPTCPA
jgi:hypothetical protein